MSGRSMAEESDRAVFEARRPVFSSLEEEAVFCLKAGLEAAGIKVHSLMHRVKDWQSIKDKLDGRTSGKRSPADLTDVVGLRVVALFLSDLPRIADVVHATFDVMSEDDKVAGVASQDAFGYMSHHLIVRMRDDHVGPRYDHLKGIAFEVQVRTILMDAWANVSHYLDYKGETSIPEPLRRDFFALSGLFYVADKHFEMFFSESIASMDSAADELDRSDINEVDINVDTLQAFLERKYPDRKHVAREYVSQLAEELPLFELQTIGDLEAFLDEHEGAFLKSEVEQPPAWEPDDLDRRFSDVGVPRVTLQAVYGDEEWQARVSGRRANLAGPPDTGADLADRGDVP
jgi:ppGpp synthetase/RelA/SpoT-type nucleotidyltranferase